MKKKANIITAALLVASLVLFAISVPNKQNALADTSNPTTIATVAPAIYDQNKVITATGEGKIEVVPDVAYVNIGVITENKDLKKAQSENATKMNNVISSLKKLGVKEINIKTTNYSVNPSYSWDEKTGKSNITGYSVNNTLEVTIYDIDKTGNILDDVVSSGSNNITGINFGVKDESTIYNQALEMAVKDAKSRATAMGKGLGIQSIEPLKITETSSPNTVYYGKETAMMDAVNTPVSQGELEIVATVSVDFTFK